MADAAKVEQGLTAFYQKHNAKMISRAPGLAAKHVAKGDTETVLYQRMAETYPHAVKDLGFLQGGGLPEKHQPPRSHGAYMSKRQPKTRPETAGLKQGGIRRQNADRPPSPFAVDRGADAPWEQKPPPAARRCRSPGIRGSTAIGGAIGGVVPALSETAEFPSQGRRRFAPSPPPADPIEHKVAYQAEAAPKPAKGGKVCRRSTASVSSIGALGAEPDPIVRGRKGTSKVVSASPITEWN